MHYMQQQQQQQQQLGGPPTPAINTPVHFQSPPPVPGEVLKVGPAPASPTPAVGPSPTSSCPAVTFSLPGAVVPGEPHLLPSAAVPAPEGAGVPV
jgi:hypothetical protein